jgi:CubicO group peptidase (beta-lactamase class C family)
MPLLSKEGRMSRLEAVLRDPGVQLSVPGLSLATVRSGVVDTVHSLGARGVHDPRGVDAHTVFEAASLTKPLVAFIALQLADEGQIDLDRPLHSLCANPVPGDKRAECITGRHVLTHTSGLPNIVGADTPFKTHFPPGERFSYGSSAFGWLQRVLEKVTGRTLEALARDRVFAPLDMIDSSLQWSARFEDNHATGQEMDGEPVPKRRPATAAASWSLQTTATDYARFVSAVLCGHGLSPATHRRWFEPVVPARASVDDVLNPDAAATEGVAWGLGWGLEPEQGCFFHWGHNPGFRAFVMGDRHTRNAVVWFANSARGLRLARTILPVTLPGTHHSLDWLQIGHTLDE